MGRGLFSGHMDKIYNPCLHTLPGLLTGNSPRYAFSSQIMPVSENGPKPCQQALKQSNRYGQIEAT